MANSGKTPAIARALICAPEYLRQAFLSAATTWTGASFAARVGLAGLGAVELGSANEVSRLRLTGADPNDRRYTGRITVGGSGGPKC
jgi:hypothetical protein